MDCHAEILSAVVSWAYCSSREATQVSVEASGCSAGGQGRQVTIKDAARTFVSRSELQKMVFFTCHMFNCSCIVSRLALSRRSVQPVTDVSPKSMQCVHALQDSAVIMPSSNTSLVPQQAPPAHHEQG